MIYNKQDGNTVILDGNTLIVNGNRYELPKRIQNKNGRCLTQINDKIYVDSYEFKDGKFRWSLAALLHSIF